MAIPDVPVKATLAAIATSKDDTQRVQKAIDEVAKMPLGADGVRGALLLKRGTYRIGGKLTIAASGVVLRGEGDGADGTILIAAGTEVRDLIEVTGSAGAKENEKDRRDITDDYVPVGAHSFTVADPAGLKVGDAVFVRRIGNAAWISTIGMDRIQGRPGNEDSTKQWEPFALSFDRVITAIDGKKVTVDAPITCAIEAKWGGGTIARYEDHGRIENCGVERLRAVSEFDKSVTADHEGKKYPSDEKHAVYMVRFDNIKNAWARNITSLHFYNGPGNIDGGAKWVTVQDARSLEPVSVITGSRRYPFRFGGQLSLFQNCYSSKGRHAFVVHARVCGPNAFVGCLSEEDYATSEPHHRWSVGGLYDNVKSRLAFQDRQWMGSGHGWSGANYVAWNCEGTIVCQRPPTAQNWAIGFVGKKERGAFEREEGYIESLGKHVQPRSLYLKQLEDRLGARAVHAQRGQEPQR
ncbi:MAG: hypothetical protein QOE14_1309 [Humisphaera sp.]|nr:hypothetical protein [Humisphaera sp.]